MREEFNLTSVANYYEGISVAGSRIYVCEYDTNPDPCEVYDLSGNQQMSEEFNLTSGKATTV